MDRRRVLLGVAAVIAVLGTLLVFVYVKGADARADSRYKAVQVLTVVKQIDAGEKVSAAQAAGKFKVADVSEGSVLPGAMKSLDSIKGEVATAALYPGEQVVATKFGTSASGSNLTIPKGLLAVSVNLTDPGRVAGFVNPGDKVSVFWTYVPKNATDPGYSQQVLKDAEVIGVGATSMVSTTKTSGDGSSTTEQIPSTLITLALDENDATKVLFASNNGVLSLGLLNDDSKVGHGRRIDLGNLFK
ncbi:MAG TPA: Flp pilus assembly protein CpaB [Marmoricola sp.]